MYTPVRASEGGVYLSFHVIASAREDSLKYAGGQLRVKVSCAPEGGRANRAVLKLLKPVFGSCELATGGKSRGKTVYIPNTSLDAVLAALEALRGGEGL